MIEYLLNASAIWLLSLAIFDLFLRKESYHGYNRTYLLFTLLLGICAPLIKWQSAITSATPLERVYNLKEVVITSKAAAATINWQNVIMQVYLIGLLVGMVLLIVDIIKVLRLYRAGSRSLQGDWKIIETGRSHAPFSLFSMLFVSDIASYSEEEWTMLTTHERRHKNLFHFADLLLVQLCRVVFWFHPLIHIYYRRLLLVHEFQADAQAKDSAATYGRFLVEQAVFNAAPAVTHSFNRSPIKKRIIMLTKTSSSVSKLKMAILLPVAAVCFTLFSCHRMPMQKTDTDPSVYTMVDTMPNCGYDMSEYLSKSLHYPEEAKKNKVQGRVIVKFIVDEQGSITKAEIKKGVDKSCDEEALRVIRNMPPWNPGKQAGKPVKVYFYLPIQFSLS